MKRTWIIPIMVLFTLAFASIAFAGVFDTIKAYVSGQAVHGAVTALFAILSVVFGAGIAKFRKPILEMYDVYRKYADAKLATSAGGKEITQAEWDGIFKEFGEAIISLIAVSPTSWKLKRSE